MESCIQEYWKHIAWVAGAITTLGVFFSTYKKVKKLCNERRKRMIADHKRDQALDEIVENFKSITCATSLANENARQIKELTERMDQFHEEQKALWTMINRHEESLNNSLEERRLLSKGLLGILDDAIERGANGKVHEARNDIMEYCMTVSHKLEELEQ